MVCYLLFSLIIYISKDVFVILFHIASLDKGVVLVRCGINWGTGVLVHKDTGTFLTCSHVVAEVKISYKEILIKKTYVLSI